MKEVQFNAQYFYDKFSKVPEKRWTTFSLIKKGGLFSRDKYCAQGLCLIPEVLNSIRKGNYYSLNIHNPKHAEVLALVRLFPEIHHTNNGDDLNYQQKTPKQRVLARIANYIAQEKRRAENDLRAIPKETTKVITKYIAVDNKLRDKAFIDTVASIPEVVN